MLNRLRRNSPWLALWLLLCVATVGFIDRIIVSVLVEPIKAEFGLSDAQVSLMGAAFAVLNVVAGLFAARFAERVVRVNLVAFGTVFWSVATALCGAAASWTHLLLARMGVGLGESIGLAGNQSLVGDYFPAARRGLAYSILLLSPPLGAVIGFVGGGYVADQLGWRTTFLVAAIPGILIAALLWLLVAEPARGQHDAEAADDVPPFSAVVARLLRRPSARNMVAGATLAVTCGFAINYFFTSLMIRRFGLSIAEGGLYAGIIASLPAMLSILLCGWLADRLGPRRPAAYALIPATFLAAGGPLFAFGILQDDLAVLLGIVAFATFLNFGFLGITYAAVQNLMHPRMRATAGAIINGLYSLAGGLGPVLLGLLSDHLASNHGSGPGLAMAMACLAIVYLWAAGHYLLAARHVRSDMLANADHST